MQTRILVIGGGFTGIASALRLARKNIEGVHITLVSDRQHFEYHGALYRLVTGTSPLEICMPLREIFKGTNVEVVLDTITTLDTTVKIARGASGSKYHYNHLVLGLGAETNYFNIPGLKELSFGMKTINDALRLKRHISEVLLTCKTGTKEEQVCATNFVVIGGGPTGMEMAADLIVYARKIAKEHGVDPSLVNVEIVEGAKRLIPTLPEAFAERLEERVRELGVKVLTNRVVEREEVEGVYLKDMELRTKTVIWTAGVMAHHLYREWGFSVDKRGCVEVDEFFRPKGMTQVYVGGDAAIAEYWGMAQTAHAHGEYIAEVIASELAHTTAPVFHPKAPIYAIPSGPGWAGVLWGKTTVYGKTGWFLRRLVDFIVFQWMLPFRKAWDIFQSGRTPSDACPVCSVEIGSANGSHHQHSIP